MKWVNGHRLGHWFKLLDYLPVTIKLLTIYIGFTSENLKN